MVTGGGTAANREPQQSVAGVSPREAGGRRAQPGASAPASRDRGAGRGRGLLRALDAVEAARARAEPGRAAGAVGGGRAAGPGR